MTGLSFTSLFLDSMKIIVSISCCFSSHHTVENTIKCRLVTFLQKSHASPILVVLLLFVDIQIFLNHLFHNSLLDYFYKGLIIPFCAGSYLCHFQIFNFQLWGWRTSSLWAEWRYAVLKPDHPGGMAIFFNHTTPSRLMRYSASWIFPGPLALIVFPEGIVWLMYVSCKKNLCISFY